MEIKEKTIVEQYRTNTGLDVFLRHYPNGSATVCSVDTDTKNGSSVFHGKYKTRHGAMVAIGKIFGKGYRFKAQYSED